MRESSTASAIVKNFAVRIALIAVTFGTGIVVARSLAPLGRGEQAGLALWPALFSGLATFGVPMALSYQSRRRPAEGGRLLYAALVIAIVTGTLATAIGVVAMPMLLHGYDSQYLSSARWLMLFTPQFLALYVIRAHLESNAEYTRSILGQLLPVIVTLMALIALRVWGILTPATAVLCYFVPGAMWTAWLAVRLWPRMTIGFRTLRSDVASLLSYGFRSYGTDLINTLSAQIDLAVIVGFLNPFDLGLYSVALTVSRLLNIVYQSLVTVMFPYASGLDSERAIDIVCRSARMSTMASAVLGLALLVLVPLALPLFYGRAFAPVITIMPFLMGEAILSGLAYVLSQAFLTTGRPAIVTLIQGGWLLCAVGLLLVLVPRMQLSGAAVALLGASMLRIGFIAIAYRVVLGRGLPRMIPDAADVAYIRAKLGAWRKPPELAVAP